VQPGLSQGMNDLLVSLVELDKDKRPSNAAEICTAFKKGRTQQVNDPNATSATVVEAAVVKLSDELVPLKNRLQQLLLEFGEIPASANAEIEALTAIADVDDGSVKTLIKQLTKENAKEIIPKINFVKHLKQVIANSSKGLDEGTLQALKQAGTSAGFAGEQVDTLFTTHQQRQQQQDEGEEYSKPNKVSAEPTAAQNHASAERETAPVHENPKSKVQLIFGVLLLVLGLGSYFAFQLYQSQQSEQLALAQKQKTEQDLTSQEQRDLAKNANGRSQQTIVGNYSDRKTDEAQEPATYRLWVNATPNNAKIVLLDIKPSYSPGVSLEPRQQRIKVKADGYHEKMLTVDLRTQDQTIDVVLEEIVLTKQDVLKDILNLADAREFIIENPRSPFLQDVKSQEYPYKVSEFGYDKNGKLESKIDYKYDRFGNEIELFSRNRSILDKNGNIKPLFEMVRQYDSSYQLIALKNYSYSSGSRSLSASVNYSNTYYGNGKLKQQVEINTKSGSRSVSKYNKYGRFISKECVKNCNQFSHKIKIEEQTNSKGLVTKSITYYNDLKATVSTKRYNSLDKLISASDQSYKWLSIASTDNMGALERKSEFSYAYSPSGHLKTLSMKTKSFDQSGKMTGTSGSTMNYDKYGVPESFDISINGVIHSKKRYQYAFKQFDFH
jgi:cell division protein FtsB